MADVRDEIQAEILDKYIIAGKKKCTLVVPTGGGKSFIAMKLMQKLNFDKVLILVNSTILRDDNWKEEFIKFGLEDFYNNNVEMATYQAAYKWKKEDKTLNGVLIIADEVDFVANTEKLSNFFYEYTDSTMVGMTGFISKSKRDWFNLFLPVVAQYSTNEFVDAGLLNDLKFTFVKVPLSDVESMGYLHFEMLLRNNQKRLEEALMKHMRGDIKINQYQIVEKQCEYTETRIRRERAQYMLNLDTTAAYAKMLTKHFQKKSETNKVIVFSKLTHQSGKICEIVYNGKNKAKVNKEIFNTFNSSQNSILGVCSKINRGVNIRGLNVGIWETFYGSDTQFVQQSGRLRRLNPDQLAEAVVILPYYKDKGEYRETVTVLWARKMMNTTRVNHHRTFNYLK